MPEISPLLRKGAIIMLDPTTGIPLGTIPLQYNPESITRSLKPQSVGEEPDRTEILRLKGPAIETIKCTVEIDATDLLASGDPSTLSFGIQPQLAQLEMLIYPSSLELIANEVLSLIGTIEILPMESALTLFAWNTTRITPVRITDLEVTEEAFDPRLNPIRAKVSLGMRVLSVSDVSFLSPGGRPVHGVPDREGSPRAAGLRRRWVDTALATLVKAAAGTGATTNQNSRYYGAAVQTYTRPDGVQVVYLARRIIPQPTVYASVQSYVVVDGDRLDNLAAKYLGDPTLYWMICDANGATDPDSLTAQVGRAILVPIASALPANARNG